MQKTPSIARTDGISLEFSDWRFKLRTSNAEPLVMLKVKERGDTALMNRHISEYRNRSQ